MGSKDKTIQTNNKVKLKSPTWYNFKIINAQQPKTPNLSYWEAMLWYGLIVETTLK